MTEAQLDLKYKETISEIEKKKDEEIKDRVREMVSAIFDELQKKIKTSESTEPKSTSLLIEKDPNLRLFYDFVINSEGVFYYRELEGEAEKYFDELIDKYFNKTLLDNKCTVKLALKK